MGRAILAKKWKFFDRPLQLAAAAYTRQTTENVSLPSRRSLRAGWRFRFAQGREQGFNLAAEGRHFCQDHSPYDGVVERVTAMAQSARSQVSLTHRAAA